MRAQLQRPHYIGAHDLLYTILSVAGMTAVGILVWRLLQRQEGKDNGR